MITSPGRASARQSRRASGAAYVESLLVIGLIVVATACGLAMFELCIARHEVTVAARHLALVNALEGCVQRSVATPFEATALREGGEQRGQLAGLTKDGERVPSWFQLSPSEGARVRRSVRAQLFGIDEVSAARRFPCNERGGFRELELGAAGDGQGKRLLDRALP